MYRSGAGIDKNFDAFSVHYVIVKAPPYVCTENTAQWECVERFVQHEMNPCTVSDSQDTHLSTHEHRHGVLGVILILYFPVTWLGEIFQTGTNFCDKGIN